MRLLSREVFTSVMVCEQEGNMLVSEEEFVYDSMRNPALIKVLASYNRARQADYIVQQ